MLLDRVAVLERLSCAFGVSGAEKEVMVELEALLSGQYAIETDRMGNKIVKKPGIEAAPRILLVGHADEVGFMVHSITPQGYLAFVPIGSWIPASVLGMPVRILGKEGYVDGLIGALPPHHQKKGSPQGVPELEDMVMDIGAKDPKEVKETFGIYPGAMAAPMPLFTRMKNDRVLMGKAWDDRAGCALLVELLLTFSGKALPNTIWGAVTVQEEVGSRGARTVADHIRADMALVLEGAPADDYPGATRWNPQSAMGKGVQIRCFDPSMIGNQGLRDFLIDRAEKESIPYQVAVRRSGGTDAGVIHVSGIGIPTAVLAIPVRYAHNGLGMIDLDDYAAALRLLCSAVARIDQHLFLSFLP